MESPKQVREFTVKAVLLGIIITFLFTASNVYLGLKVGLTFASSIPAAVISMSLLRFFKDNNILENNIVQTIASAAGVLSAIIFVLPALIIIGYWETFEVLHTITLCGVGGILGVLFTIPLRRAMVIESDLKFPEGVAAAEVLKSGNQEVDDHGRIIGTKKKENVGGKTILIGALLSALFAFLQNGLRIVGTELSYFVKVGGSVIGFGTGFSLALVGAGYIIGFNAGLSMLLGTLLSWVGALGILSTSVDILPGESLHDVAFSIWAKDIRFIGVGAMSIASLWALISLLKPLARGMSSAFATLKARKAGKIINRLDHDMPINIVIIIALFMIIPIYFLFNNFLNILDFDFGFYGWLTLITFCVLFAFFFSFLISAACGYMAGLVGSSNSPLSGIAIIAVLSSSLILYIIINIFDDGVWHQRITQNAIALVMFVTTFVIAVGSVANDNLQDLKTGQLVKATPYKQQIALIIGVIAGAVIIPHVLNLLYQAYGFANALPRPDMDPSQALLAPQANLMASLAQGIFSKSVNWPMFKIGIVIAILNILFNEFMRFKGSKFTLPVFGVAMGIYLPYELNVAIFIGSVLSVLVHKYFKHSTNQSEIEALTDKSERKGILMASGLIVGESLFGVFMALMIVVTGFANPFEIQLPFALNQNVLGAVLFGIILIFSYRYIIKKK